MTSSASSRSPRIRSRFQRDPHLAREPGEDPGVVARRGQEARDHQLPHVQAGAGRPLLREDLRPGEGLRVQLRQVQAHEAPRDRVREVRRRGHPVQGAPRAPRPHQPRHAGRAHLVPEEPAAPHRQHARHHAEGPREGPLLRGVHRHRPEGDRPRSAASSSPRSATCSSSTSTATTSSPAGMGGEAVLEMLKHVDVHTLARDAPPGDAHARPARPSARRSPSASRSSRRSARAATARSG